MVNGRKWLALALGASLVLAACQAVSPTRAPGTNAPSSAALESGSAPPSGTPLASLGDALRAAIDVDDILIDLARLQAIADEHGGNRAAGTQGHVASATFVGDELRRAGFEVEVQPVTIPAFAQDAPSTLAIETAAAPAFEDLRDFKAMLFSASGDVTAKVVALGFDPTAQPGDQNGIGCSAADWAAVPAGVIVLVQPGPCRRYDVVLHAQSVGALAVVTSYTDWLRDEIRRPTLVEPDDIRIPVLGATHAVGLALAKAAMDGDQVALTTRTTVTRVQSANVIGETPGGDPAHVVMIGGHLDSVIDGPGINDNGSGTMAVLEIAREVAALAQASPTDGEVKWKVRVAFWTGEEIGLFGSAAYVQALTAESVGVIEAYLNFDMLGSTNGIRTVYDGQGTSQPTASGAITTLFKQALEAEGLAWQPEAVGAVSDQFPLDQAGIPVGGLFSGANEHKSVTQAGLFGGTADAPGDPCYHLACDTIENVDAVWLQQMARAAAWVVGALATGEVDLLR